MPAFPKFVYNTEGFAIDNETETVLILINNNKEKTQAQIVCHGENYYIELMPETLNTIIITK
jgi:hypothetical protein